MSTTQKAAHIIAPDGTTTVVGLSKKPTLEDYYRWCKCNTIQEVKCRFEGRARSMIIDEEGKVNDSPTNTKATALFRAEYPLVPDYIVGTAVVLIGYRV